LDDVRIFTRVVEAGSFTKAAALLGLPKSTVSRRVSDLEDGLGTLLLQRTTRKLTLTHAGQLFFARTARIIEDLNQAQVALEELEGEPRGLLRITTPADIATVLVQLLRDFQQAYPRVDVVAFATGRRVDIVAEGYDLALRAGWLSDSSLISKRLLRSRLGVVASAEYLEEHGTPQSVEELTSHRCLLFGTETTHATWRLSSAEGEREVNVSGRFASNDFSLLRMQAIAGQGLALVPYVDGHEDLRAGRLLHVLPQWSSDGGSLYAVYPSARHVSPKVRAFVDFTAKWLDRRCDLEKAAQGDASSLDERDVVDEDVVGDATSRP